MSQKDIGNKIPIYKLKAGKEVENYYDEWTVENKYDKDMVDWKYSGPQETIDLLKKHIPNKNIKILDAGCGTGYVAEALIELNFKNIIGIDFSKAMLEIAKEKKIYRKLICQSLNDKIKLRTNQFELVVCTGVLTSGHVGPNAIKELIRVVKPGGYFICSIAQSIFTKNGFKKEIENLHEILKVKVISRQFVALPQNKGSAKSRLYILQKLI